MGKERDFIMTLALTGYRAYGVEGMKAVSPDQIQHIEITITGANTDLTWDFGETGGTFWTAVGATTIPANAKALLLDAASKAVYAYDVIGDFTGAYVKGHAAGTGVYSEVAGTIPALHDITFNTASAPTSAVICFRFKLMPGQAPLSATSSDPTYLG